MAKKEKKSSGVTKLIGGWLMKKMAIGGAKQLRSNADEVNKLNVFPVPDGDTGDNMRLTIESGIRAIENLDSDDLATVMKTFSHGCLLGARGNSGVILSQFFAGTAKGLEKVDSADAETFGKALRQGVEQAYSSVMTPTEGTILTVAREAVDYAVGRITPKSTVRTLFADLVKEMRASLDRTPEILTVLKEAGVVDSGGAGLLYIIDGFNRVLNGEEITQQDSDDIVGSAPASSVSLPTESGFNADSVMTYGYCTELLLQLQNSKTDVEAFDVEPLKSFLAQIGDSIVAFKTESIVKLHVHTFTPEKVLEYCRRYGEFLTVKIENMSVQHSELSDGATESAAPVKPAEHKTYGAVAVCNGTGIEQLFTELGTDEIVHGGQTQNPSANDFLDAFAKINAEVIFVFPNNGNIFMAAQQAAELYQDARVLIVPSKNIGTGYVALSSLDFENPDAEANLKAMEAAMQNVAAGYISPSIRDADLNGVHILKGDTIGILEKEIVVSEASRADAAHQLAQKMLALPNKFMLTIFIGADATEEECAELEAYLRENCPSAEIYFVNGGQDIYPYIMIAE
ncbi:MAG: DAK2 domain-containing protein [Clostridia bacterium]|nr:DAK2 domain-containing protein [Clostridia bacterium]